MPFYEHVYLARQDLSAQQVEELTAKLSGVITEAGGKITKTEYWGMKSLNYRIRKNRKAHMTLLNVEAPAAALNEVERQERLNEDVLRYLTIRVEEHEEGPSAMLRKSDRDRDDRGGRGGFRDRDRGDRPERHGEVARPAQLGEDRQRGDAQEALGAHEHGEDGRGDEEPRPPQRRRERDERERGRRERGLHANAGIEQHVGIEREHQRGR